MNLEAKGSGNGGDDSYQGLIETRFVMTVSRPSRDRNIHFEQN